MTLALLAQRGAPPDDRLRAVIDSVFARPAYNWQQPIDPFAPLRRLWLWLVRLFQTLRAENPSLYWIIVVAVLVILLAILAHAFFVTYQTVRADAGTEVTGDETRVEIRDAAWYGREAARLANAGHYAEAIQADFLRLVLQLDARRIVHFHPSRTPGEYVRETGLSPESRRELATLVSRLYAYAFARVPCGAAELREWRDHASADRYARA
jgi:Domain of unknown function (DUF4129)